MEQNKQRVGFVAAITHGLKPLFSISIASAFLNHSNNIDDFFRYIGVRWRGKLYLATISRDDKESADRAEV